jgi:hypothetical protein
MLPAEKSRLFSGQTQNTSRDDGQISIFPRIVQINQSVWNNNTEAAESFDIKA